ncbi:MAG: glycosyltransferase [Candidatus Bathyarchaeia archaeon]
MVIEGGNRAQARNLGIQKSKGKMIAFIDSDCTAPKDWLYSLTEELGKDKSVGGIGGMNSSPKEDSKISKAIDLVFSSYLGSLGSASLQNNNSSKPRFVSALACINSIFWRDILVKMGGFDEEYELCEDTNLSYKVRTQGYKLLFDSKIKVNHYRRDTVKRFSKQFFSYGMGRMRSMLTDKAYANKGALIPFMLILLFPLVVWFFPLAALAITLAYLTAIVLTGIQGSIRIRSKSFLVLVPVLFIVQHFSYFFGILYGLTLGKWKKPNSKPKVFYHEIIHFNDSFKTERIEQKEVPV